ncbi:hypothetical protein [Paenibacillus sp. Soil522]|uniref:hypothetical protein n=1 Tax=Paenibacillus sp. Soil522 TaxID=1736388 RepID=UPI0006FAB0AF|nr:hypothetical protein [Paenibacillus sp. Soil522]KRE52970.1 hypothetical protein ASG81_02770 [Paenibacillus sp. Soil522]
MIRDSRKDEKNVWKGTLKQEKIREISKVSRETISRVCKNRDYMPAGKTMKALVDAIRKLTGKQVKSDDFWM